MREVRGEGLREKVPGRADGASSVCSGGKQDAGRRTQDADGRTRQEGTTNRSRRVSQGMNRLRLNRILEMVRKSCYAMYRLCDSHLK